MKIDTTSVNTGENIREDAQLHRMFSEKDTNKPQFMSYQHHVLDRILCVVMDKEFACSTKLPKIEYPFVPELLKYEELKEEFVNGTEKVINKSGWRDDMKFLYHLIQVFRFFEENGHFPLIDFQKIPNISNARWNSRAILAILAFILIPTTKMSLEEVCRFILYDWADCWFTNQMYNKNDFKNLSEKFPPYEKTLQTLKTLEAEHL